LNSWVCGFGFEVLTALTRFVVGSEPTFVVMMDTVAVRAVTVRFLFYLAAGCELVPHFYFEHRCLSCFSRYVVHAVFVGEPYAW
jgi:hypothetical protein